jgi:Fic family protein
MRREDFTSNAAMTVRRQPNDYWAAYPNPLPPHIEPSWELFQALSDADRALSELAGIARTLPNPHLLIGPFARKEAVLSSKIEGTQASLSDLLLFEASGGSEQRTGDVKDVAAYIEALNFALEELHRLPISTRLFRQIHKILISDPTKTPGELRTSQNWIGREGCSLNEASYVPPPPDAVPEHLSDLEKYLHQKVQLPPLIKYAIVHYQFESIHPFLDGNGRLGRLLITLLLTADPALEAPLLPQPLLYLSAYFERNRDTYYQRLDGVSKRGEWLAWLTFFLDGVAVQSRDAVQKSDRLLRLKQEFMERIHKGRGSALVHQLAETLFVTPVLTIPTMARNLGRTFKGVQNAMKRLMEFGIVEEVPSNPSRLYVAWEVIRAVDE